MKFTDTREEKYCTFNAIGFGDFFRLGGGFYIKTNMDDEDGDYYAINLQTGEGVTISSGTVIEPIDIKEIIYES